MENTTITINGKEYVILPAPKGAFILEDIKAVLDHKL